MNNITKNIILSPFNILYRINPKLDLKLLFRLKLGYKLDLKNPKTYNEKLQWIKLYDRNPLMPKCVDKYTVREYIESKGLGHLLNELLWEGFNPEDIPFDKLPDKYVIKVTHGSSFNIIVKDKSKLNKTKTIKTLNKWLKAKFLPCYGEWFYGIEKPRIIIEKYLEDPKTNDLYDYKVYCFNGEPKIIEVHKDRFGSHGVNVYDKNWNFLEDVYFKLDHAGEIEKPEVLDKIIEYSEILSKDFNHVRVDFYIIGSEIIFGELTFTNGAGFEKIIPISFSREMGDWLKLPIKDETNE